MKKAAILPILLLSLTLSTWAKDCNLEKKAAKELIKDYVTKFEYELSQFIQIDGPDELNNIIENRTIYLPKHQSYFFYIANIKIERQDGHLWLEVSCEKEISLSHFTEEK